MQKPVQDSSEGFDKTDVAKLLDQISSNSVSKIEFRLRAEGLPNKDMIGLSDPFVKIFLKEGSAEKNIGVTETIKESLSPNWKSWFQIPFSPEKPQELIFYVLDEDGIGEELIGTAKVTAKQLLNTQKELPVQITLNGKSSGVLFIRSQYLMRSKTNYTIQLSIENVKDIEYTSKTDPYLKFCRAPPSTDPQTPHNSDPYQPSWVVAYQTEYKMDSTKATFKQIRINGADLCRDDPTLPFRIELWDKSIAHKDKLIGWTVTSADAVCKGAKRVDLLGEDRKSKVGTVCFEKMLCEKENSILSYISSGLKINVRVGVDMTIPSSPSTDRLLIALGDVMGGIDHMHRIDTWGYGMGGRTCVHTGYGKNGYDINTLFNDNRIENKGECRLSGLIGRWRGEGSARRDTDEWEYSLWVIVTRGEIKDMLDTKDEIIASTDLPGSWIWVVLGNDGTNDLSKLDMEDLTLKGSLNRDIYRDNSQVVYWDPEMNNDMFSLALLHELPRQIDEYYSKMGIYPR